MKDSAISIPDEPLMVGAYEAKTHLASLLRQARAGKRIIITQHGKPIAQMGPVNAVEPEATCLRGDMEGRILMADDFCDELAELKEFFT